MSSSFSSAVSNPFVAVLLYLTLAAPAPANSQPADLGERPCDHDVIGIVIATERATQLAFDDQQANQKEIDGAVLDQVRSTLKCASFIRVSE